MSNIANLGPLLDPDENGLRLPAGFSSRVIARSGTAVEGSSYVWHNAPDGGGVFTTGDGGWIYVSNSETFAEVGGRSSARFDLPRTATSSTPIESSKAPISTARAA